jgi:hypothetical protein
MLLVVLEKGTQMVPGHSFRAQDALNRDSYRKLRLPANFSGRQLE